MEKDIGKIKKNDNTDVIVRIDDFGGKVGVTIREFTTSERYTGFTKAGTRISVDNFLAFRELINSISLEELKAAEVAAASAPKVAKGKKADSDASVEDY
jgi:hypothetical protein